MSILSTISNGSNGKDVRDTLNDALAKITALSNLVSAMPPEPSFGPAISKNEGAAGATTVFTHTVNLNKPWALDMTYEWYVVGIGTDPVTATDFVGGVFPTGSITIVAGQITGTLNVPVAGDSVAEANENYMVVLRRPLASSIASIINDDGSVTPVGAARVGNNLVATNYYGGLRTHNNLFTQSEWGKNPSFSTDRAVEDMDTSGNLIKMQANTLYRKICGRPSKDGGTMVISWDGVGDTTVSAVVPYNENGAAATTITGFQVLAGQRKAIFTWAPPANDEGNPWGFQVQFISPTGNGTCIQPRCAEGDVNGNFTDNAEFYGKYLDKWAIFTVIRDLDMSIANGPGAFSDHLWSQRTPSDNIIPSRRSLRANVTLGGLVLTAFTTASDAGYAPRKTLARFVEKNNLKMAIGTWAHKILVGVNAPSGSGSHDISGPDANGDITVTVTPPSTATTWNDLVAFIQTYGTIDNWINVVGTLRQPSDTSKINYASGFTGTEALTVVPPTRMAGGTDPLNKDAQSFEMKIRLLKALSDRRGVPVHFHWVMHAAITDDYITGALNHFKTFAPTGSNIIMENQNEPWNYAISFQPGLIYAAAVGISSQAFGPTNTGTDLRAPFNDTNDAPYNDYIYGLAHLQKRRFALGKSIMGARLIRGTNGVSHQNSTASLFNVQFDQLGIAAITDIYLTADYDYSPLGEQGSRGQWATNTAYVVNDYMSDLATTKMYFVKIPHTSSTVAADLAAGRLAELTPDNVRAIAMAGQASTVDRAVTFDQKLATYTNDQGVAPLWAAYEGGTTGFDSIFNFNGTTAQNDFHRSALPAFLIAYYQSPVKREAANYHASERMRRLRGASQSYYTEYAGQGGNPYPNINHSYMMMRDLEASDDINARWAGLRDAQMGKFYGYFIEGLAATPFVSGEYVANQTLTVSLLSPYRHLTTGWNWIELGTGNVLQAGGLTYALGSTIPASGVGVVQWLTDVFGRTINTPVGKATRTVTVINAPFTVAADTPITSYADTVGGTFTVSGTGATPTVRSATGDLYSPSPVIVSSVAKVPSNATSWTQTFDVNFAGGIGIGASFEFNINDDRSQWLQIEITYEGKFKLNRKTNSGGTNKLIGSDRWPEGVRPANGIQTVKTVVQVLGDGSLKIDLFWNGSTTAFMTTFESVVIAPGRSAFNTTSSARIYDNLVVTARI
jgi:hypothetical protein